MPSKQTILQLVIACPLPQVFDYHAPYSAALPIIGTRWRVPFGRSQRMGLLLSIADHSDYPSNKLKTAYSCIDTQALLSDDILQLIKWASTYYHHPIGMVVKTALPRLLNQGKAAIMPSLAGWCVTQAGYALEIDTALKKNAHKQRALLQFLRTYPDGISQAALRLHIPNPTAQLKRLHAENWIEPQIIDKALTINKGSETPLTLNSEQQHAVDSVAASLGQYQAYLLDGVTGSGKTEVYLQIIARVLQRGEQALLLVPEINLTPQMLARFQNRFSVPIAVLHSHLNDRERLSAWLQARDGLAPIVIGTRSAMWTPMAKLGVIIIDEEHDLSYKQQGGLNYSARDLSLVRARWLKIPVLMGSATPALDSLFNVEQARYHYLNLSQRAGKAKPPIFKLIDLRQQPARGGLSRPLINAIQQRLDLGQQSLIYINRRGYAPTLMCHECGWAAECSHCAAHLTFHGKTGQLRCHHCGQQQARYTSCPSCSSSELRLLGYGTERIELNLQQHFADARILRIDSDTTRRKNAMQDMLEDIHAGKADILVGTQMLAKGHHFPNVTLVGVINIDGGLFGVDFRASERVAQALLQVAGRAGREEILGEVLIQSYHPDHILLTELLQNGYAGFAKMALAERQMTELPPYHYLALLRAEAKDINLLNQSLEHATALAEVYCQSHGLKVDSFGPIPAPLERRAGYFRAQLLLQAAKRADLHHLLRVWLPEFQKNTHTKVKWSLDIDPQDLF